MDDVTGTTSVDQDLATIQSEIEVLITLRDELYKKAVEAFDLLGIQFQTE